MKHLLAICLLGNLLFVLSCNRNAEFHHGFPSIQPIIRVLDDAGSPIANGCVKVITTYWYPSLFGTAHGKTYTDNFVIDNQGLAVLILRRHHQITKQEIVVESGNRKVFTTKVDDDMDWATYTNNPRTIRVALAPVRMPKRIYWRGQNVYELRNNTVRTKLNAIQYSLAKGEFVDSGGDLLLTFERPSAQDPDKLNKPVKLTIQSIEGRLQRMTPYEVHFSLNSTLAKWGDSEVISLEAENSRRWPTLKSAFAYSSLDGAKRALMILYANPVSDKEAAEDQVAISIWAKVDLASQTYGD